MKATVYVRLKPEVLDPQGDAVKRALGSLGYAGVKGVRVGKLIEMELDGEAAADPARAESLVREMATRLLANEVIEDFEVSIG